MTKLDTLLEASEVMLRSAKHTRNPVTRISASRLMRATHDRATLDAMKVAPLYGPDAIDEVESAVFQDPIYNSALALAEAFLADHNSDGTVRLRDQLI